MRSTSPLGAKMSKADEEYILFDKDIELIPIDEIKPYPDNARVHDERSLQILCNNIKELKFSKESAISVDKDMTIICGHGRWLAAQRLGMTMIPCVVRDDLTPEQVQLKRNSDNMAQDLSLFDNDKLQKELKETEKWFDLDDFGFEVPSFDDIEEEPEVIEDGGVHEAEENFNTIVYIDNQDDYDLLQAFLLQNDLTGKRMS